MSTAAPQAVFLSYASQDGAAVERISEALRASGVEVWFDKNELVGGDAWDAKIRKQIADCALFVPVISAATQARTEGYFRLEWKLAAQRTHMIADDAAFLLPVVIDATKDGEARVPAEFKAVQWTRLPGGEKSEKFVTRVQRLLGTDSASASDGLASPSTASERAGTPGSVDPTVRRNKPSRPWLVPAALACVAGVALALWWPWKKSEPPAAMSTLVVATPSAPAGVSVPLTEAQKLVERARKILDEGDELSRENYYLAEDLVERATKLDPTEPLAWALHARISYYMAWHSIDTSEARVEAMRSQAERAHALAPELGDVVIAWSDARYYLRQDLPGVERDLLALAAREPKNWLVQRALGGVYRYLGRYDDAIQAHRRAVVLSDGAPKAEADLVNVLTRSHHLEEAEATVAQALTKHASGRLRAFDVFVRTQWRGDLTGAEAALATWPDWLLVEDRGAILAWRTALWDGQPDKALAIAQRMQRDYLRDTFFSGPRAVLTARAHEMAGHREAARDDWHTVVQTADRVLATAPTDSSAAYWKAWALARLGEISQAQALAVQMQQRNQLSFRAAAFNAIGAYFYFQCPSAAALWANVGRPDLALAELRGPAVLNDDPPLTRAMLEFDPAFDPLRSEAGFKDILASAPAPKTKTASEVPPKSDEKSIAVLAFDNLSDDKANEYFSDGISEELLNVLAKLSELKVSARTSAFSFKGKNVPIPEIARQLGVAYVVEGSVRKAGSQVRITAQLIKAEDGFHVWSDTFTRDLKDIFAVQDEIAGLIAEKLRAKMISSSERRLPVPEVHALILQARHAAADQTNEGARSAIALFRQAVTRDPQCADAWAEIALSYVQLGRFGGLPTDDGMREARIAARRALDLEPEHPLGLLALAWVQRTNDRDWRGAIASFRHALAAAPENVSIMSDAAICFLNVGFIAEAEALAARAVERDPLNARAHWSQGAIFLWSGRPDRAIEAYRRAITLAPTGDEYHSHLARALSFAGRFPEAFKEAQLEPNERYRLVALATAEYLSGDRASGDRTLQEIISKYGDNMCGYLANLCAVAGKIDEAFRWFDRGYETRDAAMAWVKTNAVFRPLTKDPRWEQFLRKMGLADDQLK